MPADTRLSHLGLLLSWASLLCLAAGAGAEAGKPLPSWNDGPARREIMAFVARVTEPGGPDFVPPAERIAVFDNDGTLWVESPLYIQLQFALDRVRALAPEHPEWKTQQPFQAVLENDRAALLASGKAGLLELIGVSHAGITTDAFERIVTEWAASARHPRFDRVYTDLVYQPMLELLDYLRAAGFTPWIVSGGGIDFMRPFTDALYGIPPERVVGSSLVTRFEIRDGTPLLMRLAEVDFIDDKEGKPVGIHRSIGRRPIAAFGNSDGDLAMLQWVTGGPGARLGALVHHTDDEREWAYDRQSAVGRLDLALDAATEQGFTLIDMKRDWKRVFPFDSPASSSGAGAQP